MTPATFLRVYNRVTQEGVTRQTWVRQASTKALRESADVLTFCAAHGIDPERWVRAKHDAIGWRFRVKLTHLTRSTPRFMENFQSWGDDRQAGEIQQERFVSACEDDDDRTTEVIPLYEQAKAVFVSVREVCQGSSRALTGGWHPRSRWCGDCPRAAGCKAALPHAVRVRRERC